MNNLQLKPIKDILTYKFYIPSYQRGYRWTKLQVRELLDDLWEFASKEREKDEFYCLQPIVVKKRSEEEDYWDVIDGQQRLTTIFIILSYINKNMIPAAKQRYSLEYETRKGSESFLRDIDFDKKDDNIDYYHIVDAYENVDSWFNNDLEGITKAIELYKIILQNTKFIWYEIKEDIDPIEIFTRLNLGKIPLTNAELIKALFLKKDNFGDDSEQEKIGLKQIEIAKEWDQMEYALQRNEFWYFLNNVSSKKNYQTRIEFIFDIMAKKINLDNGYNFEEKGNPYFAFLVFNKIFQENKNKENYIDKLWKKIKKCYYTFEEWYNDRDMYHLIGYLVSVGVSIEKISKNLFEKSKLQGKDEINKLIRQSINIDEDINELAYGEKKNEKKIRSVLLLFNIISINNSKESNMRFPFDLLKTNSWDIEHIHSVNSEIPAIESQREEWLRLCESEVKTERLKKKIKKFLEKDDFSDSEKFEQIYNEIVKLSGEENDINDISNLTLLDSGTNRAYKNAIFPVKRKEIIKRSKQGRFIPLCTQNVFLKYYSDDVRQMDFWSKKDREQYVNEIKNTLKEYIE